MRLWTFMITVGLVACVGGPGDGFGGDGGGGSNGPGTGRAGGSGGGSGGGATDNGGGSAGGGATDPCAITPGKYTVKFTAKAGGGATCAAIPDTTVEIKAPTDAGAGDAGTAPNCTMTTDAAMCSFTSDCTTRSGGYTAKSHTEMKNSGGTITGTMSNKTTKDSDGSVSSDCTYDFTYTKQ